MGVGVVLTGGVTLLPVRRDSGFGDWRGDVADVGAGYCPPVASLGVRDALAVVSGAEVGAVLTWGRAVLVGAGVVMRPM